MDSKKLWMEAHEELIMEYLEYHPEASDDEAYLNTEPLVDARFKSNFADMIDSARLQAKEGGR